MAASYSFPPQHKIFDDVQGLFVGTFLCSFGVSVLATLGLVTGQTAGLALLIAQVSGLGFGLVFVVLNVPFYLLALRHFGKAFVIKSMVTIVAVSVGVELMTPLLADFHVPIALGLLIVSTTVGLGLLANFRHGASLGGLGVLALALQDKAGIRAGYTQLVVDALLFGAALLILPATVVAYSLAGAVGINLIIAFNHRRDWYVAR